MAQYKISGDIIKISYQYSDKFDILIDIRKKGGNNLMDFYEFFLFPKGKRLWELEINDLTHIQTTDTDWHGPFVVRALENEEGDDLVTKKFTGGNHEYTNTGKGGVANAKTTYLEFFVDGKKVGDSFGEAENIEIRWSNDVKAYNTQRADGGGRYVLSENHILRFDGFEFTSDFEVIPLEDVEMVVWFGLQSLAPRNIYKTIQYVGSEDESEHPIEELTSCKNKNVWKAVAKGDGHRFEMEIDPTVDLGDRHMYDGDKVIFNSEWSKIYFNVISEKRLLKGKSYRLRGKYRFLYDL